MSIKILGKKYFKTPIEKERDRLKNMDCEIAEKFEEHESEFGEDAYTERLQEKQIAVRKRLDEIGWS